MPRKKTCEGIVNYALSIQDVEVAAFFREMPDGRYRVSLRSKGELNVADSRRAIRRRRPRMCQRFAIDGPLAMAVPRVSCTIRPESR